MYPFEADVVYGTTGTPVATLQSALLLLIDRRLIDMPASSDLRQRIVNEQTQRPPLFGDATRDAVRQLQRQHGLDARLDGLVERTTAHRINALLESAPPDWVVRGNVVFEGAPPEGPITVVAFDRDMRTRQKLGQWTGEGEYTIPYSPKTFRSAERGTADIYLEVRDRDDVVLATTETTFNAPRSFTLHVTVSGTRPTISEVEGLRADVVPLLREQGPSRRDLKIEELTDEDQSFVVSETGRPAEQVSALVLAARAGQARPPVSPRAAYARADPGAAPAVPIDAYYGWFRKGIPSDPEAFSRQPISALRSALRRAIDENIIPALPADRVEDILHHAPNTALDDLRQLLDGIGVPPVVAAQLLPHVDGVASLNAPVLERLVNAKVLSPAHAHTLGLAATLGNIGAWSADVVPKLVGRSFPDLPGRRLTRAQDLARLDVADWLSAIDDLALPIPAGTTAESFARTLAMDAQAPFPLTALSHRVTRVPAIAAANIETLQPLLRLNADANAVAQPFDMLATEGLDANEVDRLRAAHTSLQRLANLHPGLGLHEVLSVPGDPATVLATINERVGWVKTVYDRNPDINLLALDLTPESTDLASVDFGPLDDQAKPAVVNALKAHQRIYAITANPLPALELMAAGYYSALAITRATTRELAASTGQDVRALVRYRENAQEAVGTVAHLFFAVQEIIDNSRHHTIPSLPDADTFFAKLPGYAEMFGDQTVCSCCHCQSVLGPAAYFVDLMYYVEKNILDFVFGKTTPLNTLHLQNRRPDLWELELTCDNTDTFVATLDIVNEVLERYIVGATAMADRATLYRKLTDAPDLAAGHLGYPSFNQPFAFAAERLETLLGHFGSSRYEMVRATNGSAEARVRARLHILPGAYDLIVTSREANADFLQELFGFNGNVNAALPNALLSAADIRAFMNVTALDRTSMEDVVRSQFVGSNGPPGQDLDLIIGRRSSTSIQNDTEVVKNLTLRRLDRLHRFVRLWRCLPWTVKELDYVIARLQARSPGDTLSQHLERIVALLDIQDRTGCAVDELMALWDDIPGTATRADTSLFARSFNLDPFVAQPGPLPNGQWPQGPWPATYAYTHPASGTTAGATPVTQRLLAALQINDGELVTLIGFVRPSPATKALKLSGGAYGGDLAVLYSCVRLARALNLSVPALVKTLALVPGMPAKFSAAAVPAAGAPDRASMSPSDIDAILRFVDWQRTSGFTLDEVADLVQDSSAADVAAQKRADAVVTAVAGDRSLEIADTALTQAGFTELESRYFLAANVSTQAGDFKPLERLPGGSYRLLSSVPLAAEQSFGIASDVFAALQLGNTYGFSAGEWAAVATTVFAANTGASEVFQRQAITSNYALNPAFDWGTRASLAFDEGFFAPVLTAALDRPQLLANNSAAGGLFVAIPVVGGATARYTLAPAFDPATATAALITTGMSGTAQEIEARLKAVTRSLGALMDAGAFVKSVLPGKLAGLSLLRKYHPGPVFLSHFASQAGLDVAIARAALSVPAMRGSTAAQDLVVIADALRGITARATLLPLARDLSRLAVLFRSPDVTAGDIDWIATHASLFGLTSGQPLTVDTVRNVTTYKTLVSTTDTAFYPAAPLPDIAKVREVLEQGVAAPPPPHAPAADAQAVASCLRVDVARVNALLRTPGGMPPGTFGADVFRDLATLQHAFGIMETLGIDGEALRLMASEDPDTLERAAESAYGAFRAQYADEQSFQKAIEPLDDRLREIKRDALVGFFIANWKSPFADPAKLYEYFLIDVQAGGCARTSRLVSALSSVQLYVYRVLMNMERTTDGRVVARFDPDPATRPVDEWPWRQFYRTWEANRKVTLFAETFIEPTLRDDKTPLFKELEDTLLQKKITDQSVLDAYGAYMSGFDELSGLTICGSYREQPGTPNDVLHLFGATPGDPPLFYYRSIEKLDQPTAKTPTSMRYTPWRRLNIQISVRKVSPIVFLGRLYVFWIEILTKPKNTVIEGTSVFSGYTHKLQLKYSSQRLNGDWTPPQALDVLLNGARIPALELDDRLIRDSNTDTAAINYYWSGAQPSQVVAIRQDLNLMEAGLDWLSLIKGNDNALGLRLGIDMTQPNQVRNNFDRWLDEYAAKAKKAFKRAQYPQYGGAGEAAAHLEPSDTYTLRGSQWDEAFPSLSPDTSELYLVVRNFRATLKIDLFSKIAIQTDLPKDGTPFTSLFQVYGVTEQTVTTTTTYSDLEVYPQPAAAGLDALPRFALSTLFAENISERELIASPAVPWGPAVEQIRSPIGPWASLLTAPTLTTHIVDGGTSSDALLHVGGDQLLLRFGGGVYTLSRLGTTRGREFARTLFTGGFDSLLKKSYQLSPGTTEPALPVSFGPNAMQLGKLTSNAAYPIEYDGPFGVYFREMFFHIPFLLADHLNSQQQFAQAQRWYHKIFDPTSAFDPAHNTTTAEKNRPWQYREFLNVTTQTLKAILANTGVIDAYHRDAFNPHAIARLRLSVYQKSVVMKYIDNLLDWADDLFGQFTMESVNEALMLYVMASDILGPRPMELPSCGEGRATTRTYQTVKPGLVSGGEFLIELENVSAAQAGKTLENTERDTYVVNVALADTGQPVLLQSAAMAAVADGAAVPFSFVGFSTDEPPSTPLSTFTPLSSGLSWNQSAAGLVWKESSGTSFDTLHLGTDGSPVGNGTPAVVGTTRGSIPHTSGNIDFVQPFTTPFTGDGIDGLPDQIKNFGTVVGGHDLDVVPGLRDGQVGMKVPELKAPPGTTGGRTAYDPANLLATRLVFCVPPNAELQAYWDRVEDRLYKIRHCMDIAGVSRQLALFAPELDPHMLVRLKAAGLTLADVLESTRGELPPYRFQYLIDKAKQYAQAVQSFGAQLLSALERRDTEELTRLRAVHEQNLLTMRRQSMQFEIDAADDTAESLRRQKSAIENRKTYFQSLANTGLLPWEITQQVSRHLASGIYGTEAILGFVSGALHLIPNLGSPFAITYGGKETGDSISGFAHALSATAKIAEAVSASAGLEATFQRRGEDWKHQIELANDEIKHMDKQIAAAEIRVAINKKALEVHDKSIEQTEEVFDFYRDRFTNLGLYTYHSSEVHRLHRTAFAAAFGVAKMVEQAFRFERPDDSSAPLLETTYWDPSRAGLLSGDRLLLDLHQLERRFIETNYRALEITQSFSVLQFAPDALVNLRENGVATFMIPEAFFDLYYPGHYRRLIKAVRLTIPSVVGPYTNVGATLRLTGGKIRNEPKAASPPVAVPLRHTVSVAASTAQNDAGVFEFGFRDERYMPFEGGGAIDSSWEISLPRAFRAFNYRTISDVVLHISYTASEDAGYRTAVDITNGQLSAALNALAPERLFNLRSEFPSAWAKFKDQHPTASKFADFSIVLDPRHYPFWSHERLTAVASARVYASEATALAAASDGLGTKDVIGTRVGNLFRGELTIAKPATPMGPITLYFNDNSMEDLWLLIAWR